MTSVTVSDFPVEDHAINAALGDLDALGLLYERFQDPLKRYLALRTHNNQTLADDIAGTTWEKVARSIRGYQTRGNGFEAWLFTIARHCLAEHFRRHRRRPERIDGEMLTYDQPDGSETPDELIERKLNAQRIASAVRSLSSDQRQCVTFRFFTGLTLAETASAMGKSVDAVKQLQLRGLRSLKQRLGDLDFAAPTSTEVVTTSTYYRDQDLKTTGGTA